MKQITINSNSTSSSNLTSRPSKIAIVKLNRMTLNEPVNIILEQPSYSPTLPTGHCRR